MTMPLFRKHELAEHRLPPVSGAQAGADGELEAHFEALFQEHWTRLCAMLYRMTGDWAEAEDLALEAFVQLYRRPPANQENLGGWLYRVASNLGLNALRSHRRRKDREEEAGRLKLMDAPEIDPAKALEIADEQQHVRQTLALLKPRDAQALLLRYSGLSYAELAAALQVAPSSVGTLLARAEAAFKKQYGRR